MFFDLALHYDPKERCCDCWLDHNGDIAIDETAATPLLMSVGLDRRAEPDDELPQGRSPFLTLPNLSERRGGPGDALDPKGDLSGSRCWLLDRAKETEETRMLYEFWLKEATGWFERDLALKATCQVRWIAPQRLAYVVRVQDVQLSLTRTVGAI